MTILIMARGGLEILFGNQTRHVLSLSSEDEQGARLNIKGLVKYLCEKKMQDPRKELFVVDGSVY